MEGRFVLVAGSHADTKLIRYLLGLCSQPERERIEAEYFEDEAAFQAMLTAEDDLIDAYARGELSDEERRRFETHFVTSASGRDRVQFARAFAGVVSDGLPAETKPPSTWLNIFESLRGWPLRIATVAAVIVFVMALSWIFVERRRMSNDVRAERAEVSKQSESLPRSADAEQTRNADAITQSENLLGHSNKPRRRTGAVHTQRARRLPIQTAENSKNVASLVPGVAGRILGDEHVVNGFLMFSVQPGENVINTTDATLGNTFERKTITELPLSARNVTGLLSLQPSVSSGGFLSLQPGVSSEGSVSFFLEPRSTKSNSRTKITVASSIKSIAFELRLEVAKPHREYRAAIETADGRPVTTLSWSTNEYRNIVNTPSLSIAYMFSGDYVLFLTGKISNGSFIRVAEFSFRIVRN